MSPALEMDSRNFYVDGGTMDPASASYIVRRADTELLEALRRHELCYVLASRQMGKSSLMARTARQLTSEGFKCAIVDLTRFSERDGAAENWYRALVADIAERLGFRFDALAWWEKNDGLPPLGRLTNFLDRVVLARSSRPVVIFVDEIDTTIGLQFSDDFFAAIRACLNARAITPRFKRLNFVLLGVATPVQLIRDPSRTPFNVGRGIELTDFSPSEAAPLAQGLHSDPERAAALLERVLYWTDGHPYLTQALCADVARNSTWEVDELVKDIFLSRRHSREQPNLRFVRERLTQGEADLVSVLQAYREIVAGRSVRDEPNSSVLASLRLSGVVKTDFAGGLAVRNRIYRTVFSEEWVSSELPSEPLVPRGLPAPVSEAYITYDILRRLPEFRPLACGVLARILESEGFRDEALLVYLHSLQEDDAEMTRRLAANLVEFDYEHLYLSFVHQDTIANAAVSPRGTSVLVGGHDGLARLWSTSSGRPILDVFRHRGPINTVAFSPDGKWLATGSDDRNAYIWSAENGVRGVPLHHQARVRFVSFSSDSANLITCSSDGNATVWNVVTGQPVCDPLAHKDSVHLAVFTPDGTSVFTASQDETATLWRLSPDGAVKTDLSRDAIVNAVAFHPLGNVFLTASEDGKVTAWDINTKAALWTLALPGSVLDIAMSPDGKSFVCGSTDHSAIAFHWSSSLPLSYATMFHHDSVLAVAFTPDGKSILTGSADRTMRVWNAADGRPRSLPFRHQGRVTAVCAMPDSERVLTTDEKGTVRLWRSAARPNSDGAFLPHPSRIRFVAYRPDGAMIAAGRDDGIARFFTPGGQRAARPLLHSSPVSVLAFSPTGNLVATGCSDGTICLWNPATARRVKTLIAHDAAVIAIQFSPDGTCIASGSEDRTARIWDVGRGTVRVCLQHREAVRALTFSPDGAQVLTGGNDHYARAWSLSDGKQIGSAFDVSAGVSAVAFRPGNPEMFLSCGGTTLFLWRLKKDEKETQLLDVPTLIPEKLYSLRLVDPIEYATFAPQGDHILAFTRSCAYQYAIQDGGLSHVSSHFLIGPWAGGLRWHESATSLDLCVLDTGNLLAIQKLSLDNRKTIPLQGDVEHLLSEWQWRLGRVIKPDCRVVPVYSTPE